MTDVKRMVVAAEGVVVGGKFTIKEGAIQLPEHDGMVPVYWDTQLSKRLLGMATELERNDGEVSVLVELFEDVTLDLDTLDASFVTKQYNTAGKVEEGEIPEISIAIVGAVSLKPAR